MNFMAIKESLKYESGFLRNPYTIFSVAGRNIISRIHGYLEIPKNESTGKVCNRGDISGLISENGINYMVEGKKRGNKLIFKAKSPYRLDKYNLIKTKDGFCWEGTVKSSFKTNLFKFPSYNKKLKLTCSIDPIETILVE